MKMTVKIQGMMCEHCVHALKNALEGIEGVRAEVSLKDGTAVLTSDGEIDAARVRAVIEEEGYTVLDIA